MASGNPFHLIDVLSSHDVPLVIIGDYAVIFHGNLHATEDMDVVFLRTPVSETALFHALTEVNAYWIDNEIDPTTGIEKTHPVSAAYIRASPLMMLGTDYGFLDIFDYIPGYPEIDVEELFSSAVEHNGHKYVSLEWLRNMKKSSGRPKDQLDLQNLPEKPL